MCISSDNGVGASIVGMAVAVGFIMTEYGEYGTTTRKEVNVNTFIFVEIGVFCWLLRFDDCCGGYHLVLKSTEITSLPSRKLLLSLIRIRVVLQH